MKTTACFEKALHNTCKVLIALHDEGPMTSHQIAEVTGIKLDNISSICAALSAKLKIKKQNPLRKTGFIWEAIEEPEINPRPQHVERVPRSNGRRTATVKEKVRQTFMAVTFRDKKIELLNRLIEKTKGPDRGIIIGILNDYELRVAA